jgi:hypothetical protein
MDASESIQRTAVITAGSQSDVDVVAGCQPDCELDVFVRIPPRETRRARGKVVRRAVRQPIVMLAQDELLPGSEE